MNKLASGVLQSNRIVLQLLDSPKFYEKIIIIIYALICLARHSIMHRSIFEGQDWSIQLDRK